MVYRVVDGVEQIKILPDEPNQELQEGEKFPLMFQNWPLSR